MKPLYSNEQPLVWNAATDNFEQLKVAQEEEAIRVAIEEGRALGQLQLHSGYQILASYLMATIEDLRQKLVTETDYKIYRRLQEATKAYSNVLGFVEVKVQEGRALEQLQTPEPE